MLAWGKSASQCKESVLADSGRVGEIFAGGRAGENEARSEGQPWPLPLNQDMGNRKALAERAAAWVISDLGLHPVLFLNCGMNPSIMWRLEHQALSRWIKINRYPFKRKQQLRSSSLDQGKA